MLIPAMMTMMTLGSASDWVTGSLAIASGVCWSGVLLPAPVRDVAVLAASSTTAMSGALVSIMFSLSIDEPGAADSALGLLLFAMFNAGGAYLVGQHRISREQTAAARDLVALVEQIAERQESGARELAQALRALQDTNRRTGSVFSRLMGSPARRTSSRR
jgi:hypothetical protein